MDKNSGLPFLLFFYVFIVQMCACSLPMCVLFFCVFVREREHESEGEEREINEKGERRKEGKKGRERKEKKIKKK